MVYLGHPFHAVAGELPERCYRKALTVGVVSSTADNGNSAI